MANHLTRLSKLIQEAKILHQKVEPLRAQQMMAQALHHRMDRLIAAAWPLMTDDDQDRLAVALAELEAEEAAEFYTEDGGGPLYSWALSLRQGNSRLPEMCGEVMRDVLRTRLHAAPDSREHTDHVCDDCGLSRPYALPGEDCSCSNCKSVKWTWASRVSEGGLLWRNLDGVMSSSR